MLVFLAPDKTTELGRIQFSGLGVVAIQRTKVGAGVGEFKVRLYCNHMAFEWKAATP
jgi:hypothetical protein